jgi:hypothetical protein
VLRLLLFGKLRHRMQADLEAMQAMRRELRMMTLKTSDAMDAG